MKKIVALVLCAATLAACNNLSGNKELTAENDSLKVALSQRDAELDEMSYRRLLWSHRPLTDFWRVGRGYAKKLEEHGLFTMGDIARCSLGKPTDYYNEDLLYDMFGVNAELLIDHAGLGAMYDCGH